jgi:hypothetical protein
MRSKVVETDVSRLSAPSSRFKMSKDKESLTFEAGAIGSLET